MKLVAAFAIFGLVALYAPDVFSQQMCKLIDAETGGVTYTNTTPLDDFVFRDQGVKNRTDTCSFTPSFNVCTCTVLSRVDFRKRANRLEIGMKRASVAQILGQPTFTEAKTFGQALGKPWNGLVHVYQPLGGGARWVLKITYNSENSEYFVNNWEWH